VSVETELTSLRSKLEQERGKLLQLQGDKIITETKLNINLELRVDIEEAQLIMQTVFQETQNQISDYVSDLVSSALEAVFDEPYQLKLEFVQRRGKTEADLKFTRDGSELDPMDAAGGGTINVASFALRASLWSLMKSSRNVLLLDEPFNFLHSEEAHRRVSELLRSLSEELKLQIILVTGEVESESIISQANCVFRLYKNEKGITQMEDNII